jgi:hypothetical protein
MMATDEAAENAWMRSGARCECRRGSHGHGERCRHLLRWESRGRQSSPGAWDAVHTDPRPAAVLVATQTCEILCRECYERVVPDSPVPAGPD